MIGPDPSPQEDAGESRVEFIRTYRNNSFSDNVTGIQRIGTLDQEFPDTNSERLAPRQGRNVLFKFDVAPDHLPAERTQLSTYFWFETGYFGHGDMSWSLNVHRVTTPWVPAEVSWNQPGDEGNWNAPGAGADYVEDPLYTYMSGPGTVARKFIAPVDEFPRSWLAGQNYGLILRSDAVAGNFYDSEESDIHLRPGMMLYGLSTTLPEPPEPISDISLQVGAQVDVRWQSPGARSFRWYEVYQDEVLVGVTSLSNYPVVGDGDESYSVVAADAYGRYAY